MENNFRKSQRQEREENSLKGSFPEIKILPFNVKAAEESSIITARLMAIGKEVNAPVAKVVV